MICGKCGGKTATLDTRERAAGRKRKLKCKSCGDIFETIEIPMETYSVLRGFANESKRTLNYLNSYKDLIDECLGENGGIHSG